ncbi:MAG: tRNA (guanosine(37)-N1)-methyltransferase TrmD [Bacillota bacterium]|nr:tRNA (guanosine(37)-N1)-methyltransferase TrmD [Bacillota bacterium]
MSEQRQPGLQIDILTLFPDMFRPVTEESMLGRAGEKGILDIRLHDIRDYTLDKHNRTDDYPFGGGGGMVMMPDPVFRCLEDIGAAGRRLLYMSPRGRVLDGKMIREYAGEERLVILCGHYEGVDQRILDHWGAEEVSIGDYILTGGELPAMVLIDAVARLIPGVLGNADSAMNESVYSGLLEHPQYTQPRLYRDLSVPEVLLSGNHRQIDLWRYRQSLELTARRRPDLLAAYAAEYREKLPKEEQRILEEILTGR